MPEWTYGDVDRGDWLVYVNGIEIPSRSVTVQTGKWKIPEAQVAFPPHRLLRRIGHEDRVRLTVFYLDNHIHYSDDNDLTSPTYCLLFDGEITSWNYRKTAQTKHLVYHAIDLSNSLTSVFPHIVSSAKDLGQALTYVGRGNPISTAGNMPQMTTLYLLTRGFEGIKSLDVEKKQQSGENQQDGDGEESGEDEQETEVNVEFEDDGASSIIDRPFDFIQQIFSVLTGEVLHSGGTVPTVPGETDTPVTQIADRDFDQRSALTRIWYNKWAERTKFKYKWAPSSQIEQPGQYGNGEMPFPLLRAVRTDERSRVLDAAQNIGSSLNGKPFWKIIRILFQKFYYEVGFVLAPPVHQVEPESRTITGPARPGDEQSYEDGTLMSYVTKPNAMFAAPPTFNVVWPSMMRSEDLSENYATQPTRTYMGNAFELNMLKNSPGKVSSYARWLATEAYPPNIGRIADEANEIIGGQDESEQISRPSQQEEEESVGSQIGEINLFNGAVYPSEYLKGPVIKSSTMPRWLEFLSDAGVDMHKAYAEYEHYRERYAKRSGSVTTEFDPYKVAGFPCVFVDESVSNFHLFGSVVGLSHRLEAEGRSTTIRYSNGRTFEEVFEGLSVERALASRSGRNDGNRLDAFPVNPIPLIRDIMQRKNSAAAYYKNTFWGGGGDPGEDKYVFDPDTVMESAYFDENDDWVIEELNFSLDPAENNVVFNDFTERYPEYRVKQQYQGEVQHYGEAMRYVSRPVCTMDQFIEFHTDLGVKNGEVAPSNPRDGKAATYYRQILDFNEGPPPQVKTDNVGNVAEGEQIPESDTRRKWSKRLWRFRRLAYDQSFERG